MIKKLILSLCGVAAIGLSAHAQQSVPCASDEFRKAQLALHPEILLEQERLKADIDRYVYGTIAAAHQNAKGTFDSADATKIWAEDTAEYHIPVVIHIIYETSGNAVTIADDDVYKFMDRLNAYYHAKDPQLTGIIAPFKPYIGNAHITFHLANKDPQGKPTKGIVKEYSYASNYGDESAKIGQWPPNQYLNIYLENVIGRGATNGIVLAYATFPDMYASNPYSQGVITRADQLPVTSGGTQYTIAHEIGHFLSLYHTWNDNGKEVEVGPCGDDEVDDTPPTVGHFSCSNAKLYDTTCATGYYKDYDSATYYHMTGLTGVVAQDASKNFRYIDTLSSTRVIAQTFTTGNAATTLRTISLLVDSTNATLSTTMYLYNGAGTTLIAASIDTNVISLPMRLVNPVKYSYKFSGVSLTANTTYRFVLASLGVKGFIAIVADTSTQGLGYTGGALYAGTTSGTTNAIAATDLNFVATKLRRIDYPDTTNSQNIMDYSSCPSEMFSKGQVARMRGALRSDVGYRSNLISSANLIKTGVTDSNGVFLGAPDITPTALFTVSRPFTCADGSPIIFTSRSYNDTIASAAWTFDKTATTPTSNSLSIVNNSFHDTGWVTASLTVTGNNTPGSSTYTRNDVVYVADPTPVPNYVEDFNPGSQYLGRYPIFNYFQSPDYRWELCNTAGVYDKTCIRFKNYDPRDENSVVLGIAVNTATQSPRGLYADFYTPAFDLSGFGNKCFLDFYSAGAFRSVKPSYQNDTLLVSYSTNCGVTWQTLGRVTRGDLANNGYVAESFQPQWLEQWKEQSLSVPTSARTNQVYFRFRFFPGTDNAYLKYNGLDFGTGNNFYLDRLHVTADPLSVQNGVIVKLGMSIIPNPTGGAATVRLNGGDNSTADISVTDVTGKLVYRTSVVRGMATTEVVIPASVLTVKGMYLVKVVTNGATETQKLIAY